MPEPRTFDGVEAVAAAVGEELGTGSWHPVPQTSVNAFADVTGDHQWIHVDAERAAAGPYGTTIAHGYLTLSMLPLLVSDAYAFAGFDLKVNYGLDRVRFPAPVPVGSQLRARASLEQVERMPRGLRVIVRTTIEIRGTPTPACVADTVSLLIP